MPSHKSEDYKIIAVKYHLENDSSFVNTCKIFKCSERSLKRCASKNILGLLLNQYRGEERPVCFRPEKIAVKPRKSDKRAKACDSPLLT